MGSAFRKRRHPVYRRFIRTHDCILTDRYTKVRVTIYDRWTRKGFRHVCDTAPTPMHVGKHQATGAYDVGCIVPACWSAHYFYDHHRDEWEYATELPETWLESEAGGYALKFVEQGGVV